MATKTELEKRIADLEEIIRYAIGGLDALSSYWKEKQAKRDVEAVKETLEQGLNGKVSTDPKDWPADLRIRQEIGK